MTAGYDAVPFRVSVVRSGARAVVRIIGELDCATAPELERAFADLIADGQPELVVIEATRLGFTDVVTHWPRDRGIYRGDVRVLEQVAPG